MMLTPKISKAINRASVLHFGQKRKADGLPFITHPFAVAFILLNYTDDEDVIIAGLLHDVIEDVEDYSEKDFQKEFGEKVFKMVMDVSEDTVLKKEKGAKESWHIRKEKYLEHLRNCDEDSLMISCADKIHNTMSLIDAFKEQGDKILKFFDSSLAEKNWFHEEVLKILQKRLKNPIVKELEKVHQEAIKIFGQ